MAFVASFVFLSALFYIIYLIVRKGKPRKGFWDIIRADDWYPSLAMFQFLVWTFLVSFAYLGIYFVRISGGIFQPLPDIPPNLLTVMGISVLVPVASGGVSEVKYKVPPTKDPPVPLPPLSGMLEEGGKLTLARVQMFLWTWIGVLIYLVFLFSAVSKPEMLRSVEKLSLPNVDDMLVVLMGLSQGGYVGGKLVTSQTTQITRIYPDKAQAGRLIEIFGTNLGNVAETVWFGSTPTRPQIQPGGLESWTDTRIDVSVPAGLKVGKYNVRVAKSGTLTDPLSLEVV